MQLRIRRDQSEQRGRLGGHKGMSFSLQAHVVLTPDEQELINRYKGAGDTTLGAIRAGHEPAIVTVRSLMDGQTFNTSDVLVLTQAEEELKQGCAAFRTLLDVMSSFGGEEVFDY